MKHKCAVRPPGVCACVRLGYRLVASSALVVAAVTACATSGGGSAPSSQAGDTTRVRTRADSIALQRAAGSGSLRQDAIALQFQLRGVFARMFPLDESVISLLAPDSYRAMRDVQLAQKARIDRARAAYGYDRFSVWYVSFHAIEPDARFNPSEVVVRVGGRDFRPVEIIPLSSGFAQHRIMQGQSQTALYLFDPQLDISQPVEVTMEDVRNSEWAAILRVLERERIRLRGRDTT